jgi:hypothetical protein
MTRASLLLLVLTSSLAHAQAPITDSDYAIELYDGVAIGDTALVGMGGAGVVVLALTSASLRGLRQLQRIGLCAMFRSQCVPIEQAPRCC